MRNLSTEFKTQQKNGNHQYLKFVDITMKNGTELHLDNSNLWNNGFSFEEAVSSDDNFDIGSAIINKFNIVINNIEEKFSDYVFEGAKAVVYVGLKLSTGVEKIRICTGTVAEEPKQRSAIISLTFYDNMAKFDRDYEDVKTVFPATRGQIIKDICSICGVTLQTVNFDRDNYIVQKRPDNEALTCRQMIAWVAQIGCQWAKCDSYGRLCIGWYQENLMSEGKINQTSNLTVNLDDVVITGIKVTEYKESSSDDTPPKSYLYGKEGYVLEITDNKLIVEGSGQTIASIIGEKCVGMRFRPFSALCLTDISLEAGDPVNVVDRKGNSYKSYITSVTLQPGNFESVSCGAKSAERNRAKQYSLATQAEVKARKDLQKERTEREKALEDLAQRIKESGGAFTTIQKDESGGSIFFLHNKPQLSESDMIWKMTAEAWGVSTDGGKTWNAGMTVDGDTIVRILTATGINADWIRTGILNVTDHDGKEIFYVDVDTGIVRINAQNLMISGNPVASEQYVQNKLQSLNVLNIILSNDFYSVPCDSKGNIPDGGLAGANTSVTVLWGTQDITSKVKIVVTESSGMTGTWSEASKNYQVTAVQTDTAWADFSVTYNGINVVKRFTISKLYPGADGKPGKSYQLGSSAVTVKRGQYGMLNPPYVDFTSYFFDVDVMRKPYAGRFLIEESTDGTNWKQRYISQKDEDVVRFHFYGPLTTTAGLYLSNASGKFLASLKLAKDVIAIRCTLYAAGGMEHIIDRQTVSIITDATAISSEEYFNLLTDNGRIQGIFMRGDQLFINGEYVQTRGLKAVDQNGNTTFYVNDNGEVEINATKMSISGKGAASQEYVKNYTDDFEKSLTYEDILKRLTDNHRFKGIYLGEDDNGVQQLLISFTYAKGGELTLGGVGNGNGLLRILNTSGEQIGYIDNTGVHFNYGTFSGEITSNDGIRSTKIKNGRVTFYKNNSITGAIAPIAWSDDYEEKEGIMCFTDSKYLSLAYKSSMGGNGATASYVLNNGLNPNGYTERNIVFGKTRVIDDLYSNSFRFSDNSFSQEYMKPETVISENNYNAVRICGGGLYVDGNFYTVGAKNRVVNTKNNGMVLQNAIESPEAYFSDYGSGIISNNEKISIFFDPIFLETVDTNCEYYVFITKTSKGDIKYIEKNRDFFIVHGESGTIFDWNVVCKQKNYESQRLNSVFIDNEDDIYFDESVFYEDNKSVFILEKMLDQYEREVDLL